MKVSSFLFYFIFSLCFCKMWSGQGRVGFGVRRDPILGEINSNLLFFFFKDGLPLWRMREGVKGLWF